MNMRPNGKCQIERLEVEGETVVALWDGEAALRVIEVSS